MGNAGLNHAFDEVVYGSAAVTRFAAYTESVFGLSLVAFAGWMQLEAWFDAFDFAVDNFAVYYGVCEVFDTFESCFLDELFTEFFVAC
jgi:hypothetical protein